MQIHWFTVMAQVVNLFILLWLLQRFLYKPVLVAMQRRQKDINTALADAAAMSVSAELAKQQLSEQQAELSHHRQSLLQQMHKEVQDERQGEMEKLRGEIEQQSRRWQADVEGDKAQFLASLRTSVTGMTKTIVQKVLKDMADADLQNQMISTFIRRLSQLGDNEKQRVLEGTVTVESSFALSIEQQQTLSRTLLAERLDREVSLNFSTNPDLLCGIAVRSSNYELSWDIASFLDELDATVSDCFRQSDLNPKDKANVRAN